MCLSQRVITVSVKRTDGTTATEEEKSATCSVKLKNSYEGCGILYQTSTTHTKRPTICRPSRLQTRLLHDEPLAQSPATDTWPPNGTRHFRSQPLASRHSTQLSTAAYGESCASKELSSHTYRCSERLSTHSKQQCTQTPHANTSTSSREPRRATTSARSCSSPLYNTAGNHQVRSGRETPTESDLSNMTVTRTSPTSAWQTTFFSLPAHDHHARRPYHSHNSTRPATTPTKTTIIPNMT